MYAHEALDTPAYQRLGEIYEAALAAADDPDEPADREAAYLAALRAARADGDAALVAAAWYYLAKFWDGAGEREKACTAHLRLLATENATFGPTHAELTGSWHNFGAFLTDADEPALVECGMRLSLALKRLGGDEDHEAVHQLIMVLWNADQYDRMFRWAPHLAGWTEREDLGHAHRCLGHAYGRVARHDEARAAYELSLRHLRPDDENYEDALLGHAEVFVERVAARVRAPAGVLADLRALVDDPDAAASFRRRAMNALVACGTADDLPRLFTMAAEPPVTVHHTYVTLVRRGFAVAELHQALRAVADRSPDNHARDALARFELDQGIDARAALRAACDGGAQELVGRLALLLLDDGDAAGLDALGERHPDRRAMLRVVRAVLDVERGPTADTMLAVYAAFAAWATPWAARLDDHGKPIGRRGK